MIIKNPDIMLGLCIKQGYVPTNCYLDGKLVWILVNDQQDPCAGCNLDRSICGGRKKLSKLEWDYKW